MIKFRRIVRRYLVYLAPVLMLAAGLSLRFQDPVFLQTLQLRYFDFYNQLQPRPYQELPVAVLDLDDQTLEKIGLQWPWPRKKLADMLVHLFNAGTKVVAFDAVFAEPDRTSPRNALSIWLDQRDLDLSELTKEGKEFSQNIIDSFPDHDDAFVDVIKQIREVAPDYGVVAGHVLSSNAGGRKPPAKWGMAFNGDDPKPFLFPFEGAVNNLPGIEDAASGLGSFNLVTEVDGIVRRIPTMVRLGETIYPSLAMEALRVYQGASTYIIKSSGANQEASYGEATGLNHVKVGRYVIPVDQNGRIWVHFSDNPERRVIPLWKIFEEDFDPDLVAGKILFFGTSASGLKDLRATPLNPAAAGVSVHAEIAEQVLSQHFLTRPDWAEGLEYLFIFGIGLLLIVTTARFGALVGASIALGAIVGAGALSWRLYLDQSFLLDPFYPAIVVILVYLAGSLIRYMQTEAEREEVRDAFSHYLPPAVVEQLARNPNLLKLGGETRELTFLFCDVRGFTSISEQFKKNPQGLTRLINRFLTPLTDVIMERKGAIDKYMGDCIMAFWNAPLDDKDHPRNACEAALAMFTELDELNEKREAEAREAGEEFMPLKVGVGINTGECVVGNMGSDQRFDYSVLGDAVNLASRLEGQSKNYGVGIVIGEDTESAVADDFATLELDLIAVKGKAEAVHIYTILGDKGKAGEDGFADFKKTHGAMLDAYRRRDWAAARNLVDQCKRMDATLAPLYDLYEERIGIFESDPPDEDWDGVFVADTK